MTGEFDYPYLMGNLVNICETLSSNSKGYVVDCYGTGVYHHRSLAGWTIWLLRGDVYWKKRDRDKWVEIGLKKTMDTFKRHVLHGLELREAYLQCLEKKLKGEWVSDVASAKARNELRDCSEATLFFLKLFSKEKHHNLVASLKSILPTLEDDFKELTTNVYDTLKRVQQTVDMEGIPRMQIPIDALRTLCSTDGKLSSSEQEKLKIWIQKLNKHKDEISSKAFKVKGFAGALQELVDLIKKVDKDSPITLARLAWKLEQQGCEILIEADPQHVFWRGQLKEGSKISCNKTVFTLGKMLGRKKLYGDIYHVFELKDCSDETIDPSKWVVKIGNNPLRPLIDQLEIDNEQWGITSVGRHLDTDELGKCQIAPRCQATTLDQHEWKSTELKLDPDDESKVMAICSHILWMQMNHAMPDPLDPKKLMFNKDGELIAIKCIKKVPKFDYDRIERFCYEVAKGSGNSPNPHVLNALIRIAKLDEDPVFKYYRDVVGSTFLTGKIELISKPQPMRRESEELGNNVKKLCKQAIEIRKNSKKAVQEIVREDGSLLKQVSKRLLELYTASPTPGMLSDSLIEEVCNSFKKNSNKEFFDYDGDTYYDDQYQLLWAYNKKASYDRQKVEKIEVLK